MKSWKTALLFLVLPLISAIAACTLIDDPKPKNSSLGLITTPASYYSTAKARYLGQRYKQNLDRLVERIVRDPKTANLQFANNIASVGGIGFFTHSATTVGDERYLEVVLAVPETFDVNGEYSAKVGRLFTLYGTALLSILASDSEIYQESEVNGYGLNLSWRKVIRETETPRVAMERAVAYFPKQKVREFLRQELAQNDFLKAAVIFTVEEDGPMNLVSYRPPEPKPDFRPPIQEETLSGTQSDAKSTASAAAVQSEIRANAARVQTNVENADVSLSQKPAAVSTTNERREQSVAKPVVPEKRTATRVAPVQLTPEVPKRPLGAENESGEVAIASATVTELPTHPEKTSVVKTDTSLMTGAEKKSADRPTVGAPQKLINRPEGTQDQELPAEKAAKSIAPAPENMRVIADTVANIHPTVTRPIAPEKPVEKLATPSKAAQSLSPGPATETKPESPVVAPKVEIKPIVEAVPKASTMEERKLTDTGAQNDIKTKAEAVKPIEAARVVEERKTEPLIAVPQTQVKVPAVTERKAGGEGEKQTTNEDNSKKMSAIKAESAKSREPLKPVGITKSESTIAGPTVQNAPPIAPPAPKTVAAPKEENVVQSKLKNEPILKTEAPTVSSETKTSTENTPELTSTPPRPEIQPTAQIAAPIKGKANIGTEDSIDSTLQSKTGTAKTPNQLEALRPSKRESAVSTSKPPVKEIAAAEPVTKMTEMQKAEAKPQAIIAAKPQPVETPAQIKGIEENKPVGTLAAPKVEMKPPELKAQTERIVIKKVDAPAPEQKAEVADQSKLEPKAPAIEPKTKEIAPKQPVQVAELVNEQIALLTKKPSDSIVEKKPLARPLPMALEGYIIQLSFSEKAEAQRWAEKFTGRGYAVSMTETGSAAFRVRIGNFPGRTEAERQLKTFNQDGLKGIIVNLPQAYRPEVRPSTADSEPPIAATP